jgi:hypothetical protein
MEMVVTYALVGNQKGWNDCFNVKKELSVPVNCD